MIFTALLFHFFAAHAQSDGRHHLFGIKREVVFHDPIVISGFLAEDVLHALAFVLAEHENLLPFVVEDDLAGEVGVFVVCRKLGQLLHVVDGLSLMIAP